MKKKVIAIMLCLCLVLGMTACSKKTEDNKMTDVVTQAPVDNRDAVTPTSVPADSVTPEPADSSAPEPTADPTLEPAAEPDQVEPDEPEAVEPIPIGYYTVYDSKYTDEWECKGYGEYEMPTLFGYYATEYPELAAALTKYSEDKYALLENTIEMLASTYDELLAMGDEYGIHELMTEEHIVVKRADTRLVSFDDSFSEYTGGVHGYYGVGGYTFDTQTGKCLVIGDIVNDTDAFADIAAQQLSETKEDDMMLDLVSDDLDGYIKELISKDLLNFVVSYYGVTVSFNPYEIGSYAAGIISTTVMFAEHPELFVEKYTVPADRYMLNFQSGQWLENDYDLDGDIDEIYVYGDVYDEYGDFEGINVSINNSDRICHIDESGYNLGAYLIHTDHGNFLYVEATGGSDYTTTHVFELKGDYAEYVGPSYDSFSGTLIEEAVGDYEAYATTMFDPENMVMAGRTDMIGTNFEKAHFRVGADGMPEMTDPCYEFSYHYELTSTQELTLKSISTETLMPGDEVTIPAGTVFHMLYTDCESYVIFELDDHSGVIMEGLDPIDNWGHYGDVRFDDIFEGIGYAG